MRRGTDPHRLTSSSDNEAASGKHKNKHKRTPEWSVYFFKTAGTKVIDVQHSQASQVADGLW